MGKVRQNGKKASRPVLVALTGIMAFVVVFLAATLGLNALADRMQADSVSIAKVSLSEPSYVLLIGSDSRKGTALYTGNPKEHGQVKEHADVLTLVRVDPTNYTLTFVTIPRDTVITGEDTIIGSYLDDNNPSEMVDAVQRLTGVQIDYYLLTSFSGFTDLIDSMEGIKVDVPVNVSMNDPSTASVVHVEEGDAQKLNGREVLAVSRETDAFGAHGDRKRQEVVRDIEQSIVRKALGYMTELSVEELVRALGRDCDTNMDLATVGALIMDFARHSDQVTIYSCTGPYKGGIDRKTGDWVVYDDPATWRELMLAIGSGQDPAGIVE